jgi:MFS transporter, DHA3 family, macrolide efflux protein
VRAVAAVRTQLVGYRRLLKIHDYRLLWSAQVVSTFGDRLTQIGLIALVFAMTGSDRSVGVVLTLTVLPRAVFGLFAGALADRVSRKTLLIATDCARALIVLFLALAADLPLGAVYVMTILLATATVFFTPTRYAVLPDIVPDDDLLSANTLDETTQSGLDPIAYLVGGALIATLGVRAGFGIDSVTFLASAVLIALTTARGAAQWHASPNESDHAEAAETADGVVVKRADAGLGLSAGLRAIWRDHILRANTALLVVAAAIASAEMPLTSMLVLTHWKRGAMGLGLFEASLALGFVVGAFACGPMVDRLGKGPTILAGLVATGVAMAGVAVLPFWPALLLHGVSGVFNILFFVPALTITQERAPSFVRARVMSSRGALMALALVFSYAVATVLTTVFAPRLVMVALGLLLTALTLAASKAQALRQR